MWFDMAAPFARYVIVRMAGRREYGRDERGEGRERGREEKREKKRKEEEMKYKTNFCWQAGISC